MHGAPEKQVKLLLSSNTLRDDHGHNLVSAKFQFYFLHTKVTVKHDEKKTTTIPTKIISKYYPSRS